MTSYVLVWRPTEGSAVLTYSTESKSPRVWTEDDADAPEMKNAQDADENELSSLLASRDTFEAKRVTVDLAERLLGWTIKT